MPPTSDGVALRSLNYIRFFFFFSLLTKVLRRGFLKKYSFFLKSCCLSRRVGSWVGGPMMGCSRSTLQGVPEVACSGPVRSRSSVLFKKCESEYFVLYCLLQVFVIHFVDFKFYICMYIKILYGFFLARENRTSNFRCAS